MAQGLYYGALLGLPAGAALWGFLLLGGAPVAYDRVRAVVTLTGSGLSCAALVALWWWGRWGLCTSGRDWLSGLAGGAARILRPLVRGDGEEERDAGAAEAGRVFTTALLAVPVGLPLAVTQLVDGRPLRMPSAAMSAFALLGALGAVWGVGGGVRGLLASPPPLPAAMPALDAKESLADQRREAELDSELQLAVARAKRAKDAGQVDAAIAVLETALRDAMAQGRSVAHVQLHWYLGWLYAQAGDTGSAMVMFQTVCDLAEPGSETASEAASALQRLGRRGGGPAGQLPSEPPAAPERQQPDAGGG